MGCPLESSVSRRLTSCVLVAPLDRCNDCRDEISVQSSSDLARREAASATPAYWVAGFWQQDAMCGKWSYLRRQMMARELRGLSIDGNNDILAGVDQGICYRSIMKLSVTVSTD